MNKRNTKFVLKIIEGLKKAEDIDAVYMVLLYARDVAYNLVNTTVERVYATRIDCPTMRVVPA